MGRVRALPKAINESKTGLYYLHGDYPSLILGDPEQGRPIYEVRKDPLGQRPKSTIEWEKEKKKKKEDST